MSDKSVKSQVISGLRIAAAWLLGIGWLSLVFGGLAVAFTPASHSPVLGWTLLASAAIIFVVTMDRWVKALPGILAYGVFGGIYVILSGHAVNHPSVHVSVFEGIALTVFLGASAAFSATISRRKLDVIDRIALLLFVVCFFWQVVDTGMMRVALGIALSCLIVAWAVDRFRRGRGSQSS